MHFGAVAAASRAHRPASGPSSAWPRKEERHEEERCEHHGRQARGSDARDDLLVRVPDHQPAVGRVGPDAVQRERPGDRVQREPAVVHGQPVRVARVAELVLRALRPRLGERVLEQRQPEIAVRRHAVLEDRERIDARFRLVDEQRSLGQVAHSEADSQHDQDGRAQEPAAPRLGGTLALAAQSLVASGFHGSCSSPRQKLENTT
jgi:hypothetical protein